MTTMKGLVVALGDVQGGSFPQAIVVHADSIDELKQMPFLGRVTISREDTPAQPTMQPAGVYENALSLIEQRALAAPDLKLRYEGRGSIDYFQGIDKEGAEQWARYLEVFGPNLPDYKNPAPLDAESDFFMNVRADVLQLVVEVRRLHADVERIGRERDDMERANKEQAAEIARLNAIIAGMATLPATSEPRS